MSILDSDSSTGSLGDGADRELTVSASEAEDIYVFIDDGTSGNNPASYDITVEGFSPPEDKYKFYLESTGRTDRSWRFDAVGTTTRITVTNQSGGSATFDVRVESRRAE